MWYEKLFSILGKYLDKERCYKHVEAIHKTDRWFDFEHFMQTAHYCAEQMRLSGLSEVELLPLKADGRTAYGDWVVPRAWDAFGAILRTEEEDGSRIALADYSSVPCSLMMYSAPTPAGGLTAEVMIVDNLEDVCLEKVKDRFIFSNREPAAILEIARKGGAAGIISDFFPLFPGVRDDRMSVETAFRWENIFVYPINETGLFGFSLSPQKGDLLRESIHKAALTGRSVFLHADVNTRFYDGTVYTVSGMIPGTSGCNEDVIICGHLYEQGANDNASGCGIILELACAIQKAIAEGLLPHPLRNIRFVMGFEVIGMMGYGIMRSDRILRTIGAINVDMAGSSTMDGASMKLWQDPLCNWSYLDTLLPSVVRAYKKYSGELFDFTVRSFTIGDNILADPSFGVPTVGMVMHPALSYHSSMDTMDMVDAGVLFRNAVIAGTVLCFMAYHDSDSVRWLLGKIKNHAKGMINECSRRDTAYLLGQAFNNGCLSLKSLVNAQDADILHEIDDTAKSLPKPDRYSIGLEMEGGIFKQAAALVPERNVKGTLTLHKLVRKWKDGMGRQPFYDYKMNCPLFWTDGSRTLQEIAGLTAAELGIDDIEVLVHELLEYYTFLSENGLMKLNTANIRTDHGGKDE